MVGLNKFMVIIQLFVLFNINNIINAQDSKDSIMQNNFEVFNHPQINLSVKALCGKGRDIIVPTTYSEKQVYKYEIQSEEYIWEDVKLYIRYYSAPLFIEESFDNKGFILWIGGNGIYRSCITFKQYNQELMTCESDNPTKSNKDIQRMQPIYSDGYKRGYVLLEKMASGATRRKELRAERVADSLMFELGKSIPMIDFGQGWQRHGVCVFVPYSKLNPTEPFDVIYDVFREESKGHVSKRVKLNPDCGLIEVK